MKVVTVSQMKEIERETVRAGTSYDQMMEEAGRGVFQAIADRLEAAGRFIVVLVGPGNNGGDGLVAGRLLAEAGAKVAFYLLRPRAADDANFARVRQMELPTFLADDDRGGQKLQKMVAKADLVVDALLGTGVDRPLSGTPKAVLELAAAALASSRRARARRSQQLASPTRLGMELPRFPLVVAVDCPSGLNCDSGSLDPVSIPADLTVTFGAPKVGHFGFPGAAAVGELLVASIGIPDGLAAVDSVRLELATANDVRSMLPPRPLDSHKGTFGKVMVVAGSINYTGAAALAGEGAYRSGAGLVTLAVPGVLHGPLATRLVEATYLLLPHEMGAITEGAVPVLIDALGGYDALLIGPGLGLDHRTRGFLRGLLGNERSAAKGRIGFVSSAARSAVDVTPALPPLVIDADGLNLLAELDDWPSLLPPNGILTPHPGEMARLLECPREKVSADRIAVAEKAAATWRQVVVLKGAFTVVAAPDGRTTLLPFANPALATAGSGDVLAGAISAMLAMGLEPYQAAIAGTFLHGAAGEMAAAEIGDRGVMAGDLATFLAAALHQMDSSQRGPSWIDPEA